MVTAPRSSRTPRSPWITSVQLSETLHSCGDVFSAGSGSLETESLIWVSDMGFRNGVSWNSPSRSFSAHWHFNIRQAELTWSVHLPLSGAGLPRYGGGGQWGMARRGGAG